MKKFILAFAFIPSFSFAGVAVMCKAWVMQDGQKQYFEKGNIFTAENGSTIYTFTVSSLQAAMKFSPDYSTAYDVSSYSSAVRQNEVNYDLIMKPGQGELAKTVAENTYEVSIRSPLQADPTDTDNESLGLTVDEVGLNCSVKHF